MKLATIGYEQATLPEVIARLKTAGIDIVVDVRAVASSRRPGFSKTMLAASLAAHNIGYIHLRQLGTPKAGRIAARAGRIAEMHAIFEQHLESPASQLELAQAVDIARQRHAALLCFEAEAARCHRTIVAARICTKLGCAVEDL